MKTREILVTDRISKVDKQTLKQQLLEHYTRLCTVSQLQQMCAGCERVFWIVLLKAKWTSFASLKLYIETFMYQAN